MIRRLPKRKIRVSLRMERGMAVLVLATRERLAHLALLVSLVHLGLVLRILVRARVLLAVRILAVLRMELGMQALLAVLRMMLVVVLDLVLLPVTVLEIPVQVMRV
jgi:hypothetical protein